MARRAFWFLPDLPKVPGITPVIPPPLTASINRAPEAYKDVNDGCLCLGSGCAMWREIRQLKADHVGMTGTPENPKFGLGGEMVVIGGYCGLAGKP